MLGRGGAGGGGERKRLFGHKERIDFLPTDKSDVTDGEKGRATYCFARYQSARRSLTKESTLCPDAAADSSTFCISSG